MGRIGDRARGARFLAGYLGGIPGLYRTIARADDAEAAYEVLNEFAEHHLDRAGIEVEVTGREHVPDSGYVFTYNETSVPDMLVNQTAFWGHLVDQGVTVPIWRWTPGSRAALERIRLETLPKGRPAVDALMTRFAEDARQGRRICWGGEGGLTGVDGVKPFKTGAARIAIRGQVPIVPVAVRGGQRILPLGGLRLRPGTMRVAIGEPISAECLTEDDAKDLTKLVQKAVEQLYADLPAG